MKQDKETMHLECILTKEEKLEYGKKLAEAHSNKSRAEDALKSFSTQKKAEIAGHDATISMLSEFINTGREYRYVECKIYYDHKKNKKTWTRTDTGEVARETKIPEDEKQEELEIGAKK